MLREHPTLAAFIATAFAVCITGILSAWRWPLLYFLEVIVGLYVLSRLFAGLPLNLDTVPAAETKADSDGSPPLRSLDMAGIDYEPERLSEAYQSWKEHQDGALADPTEFEHLARDEMRKENQ